MSILYFAREKIQKNPADTKASFLPPKDVFQSRLEDALLLELFWKTFRV